ncbi:DUF2510 domain-containing protein [Microbacterium sp. XT11]|uniref:DUF2510 domain-containing protein n=1 Tax=Microbacterium sp. XT11 TaxID=367477 RepID=UPI00083546BB|nr:DUF2510 domain-containing protein [Microbacterium sp. XT11]
MTTPAGWYDDGSGRQRWWDGVQWTEHFAPAAASAQTTDAAAEADLATGSARTEALAESDAAVSEAAPNDAVSNDAVSSDAVSNDAVSNDAASNDALSSDAGPSDAGPSWAVSPGPDAASEAVVPPEAVAAPEEPRAWAAPSAPSTSASPEAAVAAPEAAAPAAPLGSGIPPYAGAAPYQGQAQPYPGTTSTGYPTSTAYPGAPAGSPGVPSYPAAGGYPAAAYAAAPAAPASLSVVGLIGLGLAAVGTILTFFAVTWVLSWVLLGAGLVVSIVSLFLKGKKWPGIVGLALSVVGMIVAVVMAVVFLFAVGQALDDLPSAPPASDTGVTDDGADDDGTTDGGFTSGELVEGTAGEPVSVTQLDGTSEFTVKSASWSATSTSGSDATNGGYLTVDITWKNVSGTTHVNPFYLSVETAEGAEGVYDFFADEQISSGDLSDGASVDGLISFDVAQSSSYTVIVLDELMQEVARIAVEPSAG